MANQVPLYKIPEKLEVARVLDDSVLPAYNESIQPFNPRAREVLGSFGSSEGQLTGSNPPMLIHLMNQGLVPLERVAERSDLENVFIYNPNAGFVRGNLVDFGLALVTPGDSYRKNDLPARVLAEQLKQRGISLDSGKLIPFNGLKNKEDTNSYYGLVFELSDQFEPDSVRDLQEFRWDYTRNEGLSVACLDWSGGWGYDDRFLGGSDCGARVVVVGGEATAKNF